MHLHALVFICLSRSVHLLDDHGNAVTGARVRSRGFDVGQRVERKADGASGVITEITAEHVVLQTAGGQLKEATAEGFVEGLWQKATERQAPEMVHDWATRAGPASVEFQRCLLRSQIFEALRQQHEDLMPDLADAVSVSQKPREIRALQDFAAKGLVVPVTTTRVDIKREEDAEHGAGLIIGKVVSNTIKFVLVLQPATVWPTSSGEGFVNPAWVMKTTTSREEANMEVSFPAGKKGKEPFQLPVIRNFCKVTQDSVLVLHRKAKEQEPEELKPVPKKRRQA